MVEVQKSNSSSNLHKIKDIYTVISHAFLRKTTTIQTPQHHAGLLGSVYEASAALMLLKDGLSNFPSLIPTPPNTKQMVKSGSIVIFLLSRLCPSLYQKYFMTGSDLIYPQRVLNSLIVAFCLLITPWSWMVRFAIRMFVQPSMIYSSYLFQNQHCDILPP